MARLLKRLFQRLLIFGWGIFSVWLIVYVVFDTADQRLPWLVAVSLTYAIAAYIILPRAVRVGLKSCSTNRCLASRLRPTDCLAIPSTLRWSARASSFAWPLRRSVGRRRID